MNGNDGRIKESEREQQIRYEEQKIRNILYKQHQTEIKKKDNVIAIMRNIISMSRRCYYYETNKKYNNNKTKKEHKSNNSDDDDDDDGCNDDDDDDRKLPPLKKPRVALEDEAPVYYTRDEEEPKPDANMSDPTIEVAVKQEPGLTNSDEKNPMPDPSTSKSDADVTISGCDNGHERTPDKHGGTTSLDDTIRDNLLALLYVLFDTLFVNTTDSFQPKKLCEFLVKTLNDREFAEEMALAAVEKTSGSATHVRYVLQEMVPHSMDPANLVKRVKDSLGRDEGRMTFLEWQIEQGDVEGAFNSALQIRDETMRVKTCLPLLEDKEDRRKQLKKISTDICSYDIIGVFEDKDWPSFLAAINLPEDLEDRRYYCFRPSLLVYLKFAVNSLSQRAGKDVGTKVIKRIIRAKWGQYHSRPILRGSLSSVHNDTNARDNIIAGRNDSIVLMKEFLSSVQNYIEADSNIKAHMKDLSINLNGVIMNVISEFLELPPPGSGCTTNHRDLMMAYKCPRCRHAFSKTIRIIGLWLGLRQHDMTKLDPCFSAIGIQGDVNDVFNSIGIYKDVVDVMLSDINVENLQRAGSS